jgi:capsular polysaccharide biosynthesis protein/MinD-like ATPase involved in chromosome partitioning or flagellar assembly
MTQVPGPPGHEAIDDQPVDVPRFVAALRRAWWLIALIVVPLTGAVLLLSLALPKTYDATARLVVEEGGTLDNADGEAVTRRLATIQTLLTSREVLTRAAEELPGETADTLEDKVSASVDDAASIVNLHATDNDPEGAAAIANRVAETFIADRRGTERDRFAQARRDLQAALDTAGSDVEAAALRERLSELSVAEVTAAEELELAEAARAPQSASSPLPLQNTLFALFAATFLAVLAVLAREAVAPRLSGPRELSRLTGLLPLVVVPKGRPAAEAYQTLAASLRLQVSDEQRVILVTSAHRGEGRTTVAEGLARALGDGGVPTLLVAGDVRRSTLHEDVGVPPTPGLAEVLGALEQSQDAAAVIRAAVHSPQPGGALRVLPAGSTKQHPASLLSGAGLGLLFDALSRSKYRFVIVDGAPLIGPIDGQLLARWADALLVVCRLDRLSPDDATGLAEVLARVDAAKLGAVVIGGAAPTYALGPETFPHRTRPYERRDEPQVAPVQRVDEEAVRQKPAPRPKQRRRANTKRAPAGKSVAKGEDQGQPEHRA